jgi:hypothetical protein
MEIEALAYSHRDNSNVHLAVQLNVLSDAYSVVDPIRLLLVLALRTGNVTETSITTLLETTRKRWNRTVAWVDGKRPVLCAKDSGHTLLLNRPAPSDALRQFMQNASGLVGMLKLPGAHDVRRGAAFETNAIAATSNIGGNDRAASLLGHSSKARDLTARYIGGAVDSRFEERLEVDLTNVAVKAPQLAQVTYVKPRHTIADVNNWVHVNKWSDNSKGGRRKARRHMDKEHREEWEKANDSSHISEFEAVEFATPDPTDPVDTATPTSTAVKSKTKRKRKDVPSSSPDAEIPVDPRLESFTQRLGAGLSAQDLEEFDDMFDMEVEGRENFQEDLENATDKGVESTPSDPAPQDLLEQPFLNFIDHFSRINVTMGHAKGSGGGSRDPRTQFLHVCSKGCGKTEVELNKLSYHEARCTGVARYVRNQGTLKCPDCGRMFKSDKSRAQHIRDAHKWVPKPCTNKECNPTVLYETYNLYKTHRVAAHMPFQPRVCPDCVGEAANKVWRSFEGLKSHYVRLHLKTSEQFAAMMAAANQAHEEVEE